MRARMIRLLRDPKIDPDSLSEEGWNLAGRDVDFSAAPAQLAVMLEEDQLVLTLLHESRVDNRAVEKSLTLVRRWLALTCRHDY